MNLVNQIMNQLSGDALGKLSGLLGTDGETTEQAASAAVPSLLAGLAGLASQAGGPQKITTALGNIDTSTLGNLAHMLGGNSDSLTQKGGSLLSSLFGDSLLSSIATAISRFSGLNAGAAKSLLAALAPMVFGQVASQWKSRGASASALTSLLAEQKHNIADAIPSGFTLPEVPGLAKSGDTVRAGGRQAESATKSVSSWALPLAILAIGAFLLWSFLSAHPAAEQAAVKPTVQPPERTTVMKPVVPDTQAATNDVSQLTTQVGDIFKSATDTFSGIKDAASAEAALPQLQELKAKLATARESVGRLPEMSRTTIRQFVEQRFAAMKDRIDAIGLIPGISAEVKALMNEIVNEIKELSGTRPAMQQ
jgi:Bacterial protein of unknown function (DUF937)